MTEKNKVFIPFTVHTAVYGYDWSSLPSGQTRTDLDAIYTQISSLKPSYMQSGDLFLGVLAHKGLVVAFAVQTAHKWDANGRDAEYAALAILPSYAAAAEIDFSVLLAQSCFRQPTRTIPEVILYEGPASARDPEAVVRDRVERLRRREILSECDFASLGALIADEARAGEIWLVSRLSAGVGEKTLVEVRDEVTEKVPEPEKKPEDSPEPKRVVVGENGFDTTTVLLWAGCILVVIIVVIVSLAR